MKLLVNGLIFILVVFFIFVLYLVIRSNKIEERKNFNSLFGVFTDSENVSPAVIKGLLEKRKEYDELTLSIKNDLEKINSFERDTVEAVQIWINVKKNLKNKETRLHLLKKEIRTMVFSAKRFGFKEEIEAIFPDDFIRKNCPKTPW